MQIQGQAALVTGGGSGLGAETARQLARRGAKVAVLDVRREAAQRVADEITAAGGQALALACDITSPTDAEAAIAAAAEAHGPARLLLNIAGIGTARRLVGKDGTPMPLEDFRRVIEVNLVGTFNMTRLAAAAMLKLPALDDGGTGERGVIVCTASVAAFDGQVGQEAYAASKGGVAAMTLPLARDLAQFGVRAVTIAPGLFHTPLMDELPQTVQDSLAASIPFPKRLGRPSEFAALAASIIENTALNGEVIRLDGALRMAPR